MFIDIREAGSERERERDGEKSIWERNINRLPLICAPNGGLNPQTFGVQDDVPTSWVTRPGQDYNFNLFFGLDLHLQLQ